MSLELMELVKEAHGRIHLSVLLSLDPKILRTNVQEVCALC